MGDIPGSPIVIYQCLLYLLHRQIDRIVRTSRLLHLIAFGPRWSEAICSKIFTDISRVCGIIIAFSIFDPKKIGQRWF